MGHAFALTLQELLQCDEVKMPNISSRVLAVSTENVEILSLRCPEIWRKWPPKTKAQGTKTQNILSALQKTHAGRVNTDRVRIHISRETFTRMGRDQQSLPTKMQRELRAICDGAESSKFEQRQPGHMPAVLLTRFL